MVVFAEIPQEVDMCVLVAEFSSYSTIIWYIVGVLANLSFLLNWSLVFVVSCLCWFLVILFFSLNYSFHFHDMGRYVITPMKYALTGGKPKYLGG